MRMYEPIGTRKVGVFAPSGPVDAARLDEGLRRLGSLGFEPHVDPQARMRDGFLAGPDPARRQAFERLLADPDVGAIIAARGGYGASRWAETIDIDALARSGKALVGFSDVTVLHAAAQRGGLQSIHGPVVTQLATASDEDAEHLARILREPAHTFELETDIPPIHGGSASGPLVGGCLSLVVNLVGTPLSFVPDGALLLLEEVGEAPYRIDRMLTQLHLSGTLRRVAGVVIGELVACQRPSEGTPDAEEVLAERLHDLGVPVSRGFPIGHGRRNRAVPLGRRARLDADRGVLRFGSSDPSPNPG